MKSRVVTNCRGLDLILWSELVKERSIVMLNRLAEKAPTVLQGFGVQSFGVKVDEVNEEVVIDIGDQKLGEDQLKQIGRRYFLGDSMNILSSTREIREKGRRKMTNVIVICHFDT